MSLRPTKVYTFALGPGGSMPMLVQGSYWKIASSTGVVDVIGDTFGTVEGILAGQGLRGHPFQRLVIADRSGSVNMIRLLVADELFVDDRITGEVSVIEGGKARSIAGASMGWRMTSASAAAGNRALSQIWNPAGSGRRAIVDAMVVACNAATDMAWGLSSVRLDTPAPGVNAVVSLASVSPPATVMEPRVQESAAFPSIAVAGGVYMQANVSQRIRFERPFVVNPGTGFLVGTAPSVIGITGALEFFEESIV